jgi:hypothetical protein
MRSQPGSAVKPNNGNLSSHGSRSGYGALDEEAPFGKAFYLKQASFTVIPLWLIVMSNTTWQAVCTW